MLLRDLRYALRSAQSQPGITLAIVLTLAVGIGANIAIFALLCDFYWWDFQAPEPERLFYVRTSTVEAPFRSSSYPDAVAYRESLAGIAEMAHWTAFGSVLSLPSSEGTASTFRAGLAVSSFFFDIFGVYSPHGPNHFTLGRGFRAEEVEAGGPPVMILDHTFWRRHLGADPAILGKVLKVNGVAHTVVGVAPRGFQGPGLTFPIYLPLSRLDHVSPQPVLTDLESRRITSLLRLGREETRAAAAARLDALARSLDRERPWKSGERKITLVGVEERLSIPNTGELMLAGAVGLLLLLATANVANLLLARAVVRQREIAILAAIGADGWRITARLLTESVLLAGAGGVLGLAVARWLTDLIKGFLDVVPVGLGGWAEGTEWMSFNEKVLLFTLAVTLLTGCLFGLAPVLVAARTDLVGALKSGNSPGSGQGRRFGARQILVVTQVLISTVLVLAAGLLVRSLRHLEQRDLGFETERQLLVALSASPPRLARPEERRQAQRELYESARRNLAEMPGALAASLTLEPPGGGGTRHTRLVLPGRPDESFAVDRLTVGLHFFETFGIALRNGRPFDTRERSGGTGAVMVNQAFVDRFWEGKEPLGRELRLPDLGADTRSDRFTVIGTAVDVRHTSRRDAPEPLVYVPITQHLQGSRATVVVRTAGPPRHYLEAARKALIGLHPDLAVAEIDTFERQRIFDLQSERLYGAVAGLIGLFGLGVACLGIYSVMSCSVSYRVRELGVRMALGASLRDVVRLILGEALVLITAGVLLGVAAALALSRLLTSVLYGVDSSDPQTFAPLALLLVAVGLAAAWLPAQRAGRLDPKSALSES